MSISNCDRAARVLGQGALVVSSGAFGVAAGMIGILALDSPILNEVAEKLNGLPPGSLPPLREAVESYCSDTLEHNTAFISRVCQLNIQNNPILLVCAAAISCIAAVKLLTLVAP